MTLQQPNEPWHGPGAFEAHWDHAWARLEEPDGADECVAEGKTAARAHAFGWSDDAVLQSLMMRIVGRDESALAVLYDATSERVYRLVADLLRHPALAEAVVEDTFWQAWRQAPRFGVARGPVLSWLRAIARSRAIDACSGLPPGSVESMIGRSLRQRRKRMPGGPTPGRAVGPP